MINYRKKKQKKKTLCVIVVRENWLGLRRFCDHSWSNLSHMVSDLIDSNKFVEENEEKERGRDRRAMKWKRLIKRIALFLAISHDRRHAPSVSKVHRD